MLTPTRTQTSTYGRHVVILNERALDQHVEQVQKDFGTQCVNSCSVPPGGRALRDPSKPVVLKSLGLGIFNESRDKLEKVYGPENVIRNLRLSLPGAVGPPNGGVNDDGACVFDETHETWGRQVVDAPMRGLTGRGVKVCVVDSGLNLSHPDFRRIPRERIRGFSQDESIDDVLGHGTHCAGIICGAAVPKEGPRYGIAPDVDLYVANIFGMSSQTFAADVVEAVEWAIAQRCDIISMSLQRPVQAPDNPEFDAEIAKFERIAQRALAQNILLVACTGNSSNRAGGVIDDASFPARCPSVLAVGGVNRCADVLNMSNRGAEVFGPGFGIRSATFGRGYLRMSGTSMAAAFVSGVAALHAENDPALRGQKLLDKLKGGSGKAPALPIGEPAARLVQAPLPWGGAASV